MAVVQVPYTKLTSLNIGSSVTIKGTPAMSFIMSPELQVDFHTGTQEDSDIAFSFRVYFGNCVVMNSRQFGDWKAEEKYEGMPFVDGQPFELCISVLQNEYQVSVPRSIHYMGCQGCQRSTQLSLAWPSQSLVVHLLPLSSQSTLCLYCHAQVKISTHAFFSTVENFLLQLQPSFLPVLSFFQFSCRSLLKYAYK
ncbi:galactoside-binding soluble lectin 13-like isoform X1 [Pipistrellus kuhlii]|uniref:galactoside-binding soluble lectin 13-like isoform X1 n=1 Tax=Pipistrellus kuhlii TaxID=59472 RepID=UPI001E274626|nr:galactoside-binding soluble lectin 13-like isoform X1 [Pipistrellus kuhlii]